MLLVSVCPKHAILFLVLSLAAFATLLLWPPVDTYDHIHVEEYVPKSGEENLIQMVELYVHKEVKVSGEKETKSLI